MWCRGDVEVTVELGEVGGESGDQCGRNVGIGEIGHVVQDTGGSGVWGRRRCVREGGRLKIDHHGFVVGELDV